MGRDKTDAQSMKPKIRMLSVQECRNYFYDALEAGFKEEAAIYFETMYQHYQNRGKRKQVTT